MNRHQKTYRAFALCMLSLAAILMLAPTILPHHHDGDAICFCSHPCSHSHDGSHHDHSTHTDTDAPCTLSINYYSKDIDRDDIETIFSFTEDEDSHSDHYTYLPLCHLCHSIIIHIPTGPSLTPLDKTNILYNSFSALCISMRAPPIFS